MTKAIVTLTGIIVYGITSTAGIVSSAPIDFLLDIAKRILAG